MKSQHQTDAEALPIASYKNADSEKQFETLKKCLHIQHASRNI